MQQSETAKWDASLKAYYAGLKSDGLMKTSDCVKADSLIRDLDAGTSESKQHARIEFFKLISIKWLEGRHYLKELRLDLITEGKKWGQRKRELIERINAIKSIEDTVAIWRDLTWVRIEDSNENTMGKYNDEAIQQTSINEFILKYIENVTGLKPSKFFRYASISTVLVDFLLKNNISVSPDIHLPFNLKIRKSAPGYNKVLELESRIREEVRMPVEAALKKKLEMIPATDWKLIGKAPKIQLSAAFELIRKDLENTKMLERLQFEINSKPQILDLINNALGNLSTVASGYKAYKKDAVDKLADTLINFPDPLGWINNRIVNVEKCFVLCTCILGAVVFYHIKKYSSPPVTMFFLFIVCFSGSLVILMPIIQQSAYRPVSNTAIRHNS